MPKNLVDITGVAALNCTRYVILRYSYHFQATFSFQGCNIKRKLMHIIFRDNIFNVVPKKFDDFYWSLQLEKSTVSLKFE